MPRSHVAGAPSRRDGRNGRFGRGGRRGEQIRSNRERRGGFRVTACFSRRDDRDWLWLNRLMFLGKNPTPERRRRRGRFGRRRRLDGRLAHLHRRSPPLFAGGLEFFLFFFPQFLGKEVNVGHEKDLSRRSSTT